MGNRRKCYHAAEQGHFSAVAKRVCLVLILVVIWTKVLPHQMIAWLFTIHDER